MKYHAPVLAKEVLSHLNPRNSGIIVDGTLGDGGHAELLLENSPAQINLLGIDQDLQALGRAKKRLARFGDRISFAHGNFSELATLLKRRNIMKIDGLLLDLGVSSMQLDTAERGFSFRHDGPLDMRMNRDQGKPAAQLLVELSDRELGTIIKEYGEEKYFKQVVRAIRRAQAKSPITTTLQLSDILSSAIPKSRHTKIHPATRTFQALRIALNHELEHLKTVLRVSLDFLEAAGRLVIISFHSLEDRIVKQFFKLEEKSCICPPKIPICVCGKKQTLKILTAKPVIPSKEETAINPRASSSKLRAAERIYV